MQPLSGHGAALGSQTHRQLLQHPTGHTVLQRSSTFNKLSMVQYLHDELYIAKAAAHANQTGPSLSPSDVIAAQGDAEAEWQ